jgi:Fe-S oxidoreductase
MADTFTRFLEPQIGDAAIRVLEAVGAQVTVVDPGCCGRPFLSQGLVAQARRRLERALGALHPFAAREVPILILEPSCWSMLARDAATVIGDPRTESISARSSTLETWLADRSLPPLRPRPETVAVHPHCHTTGTEHAAATIALLRRVPELTVRSEDGGCCGMAGAFGYRHQGLSTAIGQASLQFPSGVAIAAASGVSCRNQICTVANIKPMHPVELVAQALPTA